MGSHVYRWKKDSILLTVAHLGLVLDRSGTQSLQICIVLTYGTTFTYTTLASTTHAALCAIQHLACEFEAGTCLLRIHTNNIARILITRALAVLGKTQAVATA